MTHLSHIKAKKQCLNQVDMAFKCEDFGEEIVCTSARRTRSQNGWSDDSDEPGLEGQVKAP